MLGLGFISFEKAFSRGVYPLNTVLVGAYPLYTVLVGEYSLNTVLVGAYPLYTVNTPYLLNTYLEGPSKGYNNKTEICLFSPYPRVI
jgi:hypothetical protein